MTAVRSCGSTFSGFRTSPLPVLPIGEWGLKAEKIDCFLFFVFLIYASPFILHPLVPLFSASHFGKVVTNLLWIMNQSLNTLTQTVTLMPTRRHGQGPQLLCPCLRGKYFL